MKIIDMRALRGPNYYSSRPVILMKLDIEELEDKPTDLLPNFKENIVIMMPSLYEHTCSPGIVGGFFQRLIRGTWAGHVVEHIAIELQCLAGYEVSFGKTFNTEEEGIYNVVYSYLDENDDEISISVTENQILFQTENIYFLSRLLEGNYPETSRLIPDQSKTTLLTKTKDLLQAIDRASLLARENKNSVVKLETKGDKQYSFYLVP